MDVNIYFWLGFMGFVLFMLALDLGVFHKTAHVVSFKESCVWSGIWVSLALIFNAGIYFYAGKQPAIEFLTGYIIEYSLSVDNVFVFIMLFTFFAVPPELRFRVLLWGITMALVLRLIMIFAGVALIQKFGWIIYIFGAFLIITGIKMLLFSDKPKDIGQNPVLKLARKMFQFTDGYEGNHFFVRRDGKTLGTPLFLVLIMVGITDVIFAVDSIPAILAITQDTFIVFTSNAFAILGLRSMFFMLAGVVNMFRYLKVGLSVVLTFIGTKMVIHSFVKIPTHYSLMIVIAILGTSIIASAIKNRQEQRMLHHR